jgi:hypothetical protein
MLRTGFGVATIPGMTDGPRSTSGNTASQLQYEWEPRDILLYAVFFSALLASEADVDGTVGGVSVPAYWRNKSAGGVGMYYGWSAIGSRTGTVVIKLYRGSDVIAQVTGEAITTSCTNSINNYNAWVGSHLTKELPLCPHSRSRHRST